MRRNKLNIVTRCYGEHKNLNYSYFQGTYNIIERKGLYLTLKGRGPANVMQYTTYKAAHGNPEWYISKQGRPIYENDSTHNTDHKSRIIHTLETPQEPEGKFMSKTSSIKIR